MTMTETQTPQRAAWVSPYADAKRRFEADTTEHKMTVLLDHTVYRHVRFSKPGTGMYHFDLITSPWQLTVRGDMGTYVFSRIYDMFNFFDLTSYGINPGYWGEKLEAIAKHEGYQAYSVEKFTKWVNEDWLDRLDEYTPQQRMKIRSAIDRDILNDDGWNYDIHHLTGAQDALTNFECEGFTYSDVWEHTFEDYSSHYLWACHAIQWGIQQFKIADAATRAPYTSKRWTR